jgi:molecular chaperone GrpE
MEKHEQTEATRSDTPLAAAPSPAAEGLREAPASMAEEFAAKAQALAAKAQELAAKTQEFDRLQDRFLRLQAEFENFKKRTAREKAEFLKFAHEGLVLDFLPALDGLERALRSARAAAGSDSLIEGLEMIVRLFRSALDKAGVKAVEALGQPFDPTVHQAVALEEGDGDPVVVEEVQKGYCIEGRVLRPAMVKVSRAAAPVATDRPSSEDRQA